MDALPVTTHSVPDWIRRAATLINRMGGQVERVDAATAAAHHALEVGTGWANYSDSGSTQTVTANTNTVLLNNAASVIDDQKPSDVPTFYDGSRIRALQNDSLAVLLEFTFTPSDDTASMITAWVEIGAPFGPLFPQAFSITSGSGMPFRVLHLFNCYVGATWAANGALPYIRVDGPGTITARRYLINRLHRGR